jgi:diguanylate cyclase
VELILNEARAFISESRKLEKELVTAGREVDVLKKDLIESTRQVNALKSDLLSARNDAMTDPLTGLFNRRGFDRVIKETVTGSIARNVCFSLLMADLDYFKNINDTYGHLAGDKVLVKFAEILKQKMRSRDFLARYGGEEFVMILPHTTVDDAEQLADEIRQAVLEMTLQHPSVDQEISGLSVSLGVTEYHSSDTVSNLVSRCDSALYAAKHKGRDCVVKFAI